MILPRRNRVAALAIVFAVLFVVAVALQALIVVPLLAVEEGPLDALRALGRAWGVFHPWHGDAVVALELVGMGERLDHFPAQLSGGEQQRVAIARAIVKRPDLLLCDEPTGALDYETGKRVLEVIAEANRELGTTAIVITHNAAIAGMADRVIRIADGRIAQDERNATRLTPSELRW